MLRTICWLLAFENIVEMAGFAMLVLLAQDVLGLDARGYGLLLACLAVGGVLGGAVAARLHRRLGDQGSVVGSILLMSAAWALLAATSLPVVAGAAVPSGRSGLTDRPGIAATLPRSRTVDGPGLGGVAQR